MRDWDFAWQRRCSGLLRPSGRQVSQRGWCVEAENDDLGCKKPAISGEIEGLRGGYFFP
jgi:hypothetical protein